MIAITVKDVAERIHAKIIGDESFIIDRVESLDELNGGGCIVPLFYSKNRGLIEKADSPVCVLTNIKLAELIDLSNSKAVALLVHDRPDLAFADILDMFIPAKESCKIDSSAMLSSQAAIGSYVSIGPCAVIEECVIIEDGVIIGAGAVICKGSVIGKNAVIGPNAVIGHEGFGFLSDNQGGIRKIRQVGGVLIGTGVEIGAGSCVDRGTVGNTVIGDYSKIDNLVQIGHNVKIGKLVIIAAQTGIAGSTVIEDGVMIGGQGGIADHLHIGKGAKIAAKSGVIGDVKPGEIVSGYPAMPRWQWLKAIAKLKKL